VGKIVVVDALPYVGLMFSPQASVAAFAPQANFMRDQMIGMPDAAFAAQQALGVVRLVSGSADQARVAAWTVASDRHVFAQAFYDAMTMDVRPRLATLKTPATLFYAFDASAGQQEAPTDAMFRGAYQTLPHIRFRRFDNSRHFIMLDQPMAFVQALAEELALH
jgi:pimeloyl-ACP methyl ester carboxylesterase